MYKAIYLVEVENDIIVAKQWYAQQQNNLDVRFSAALEATLLNILEMPFMYAIKYRNIRIAKTKTFPYNIHFCINEAKKQVAIIGIVHNKRNNALFLDR